jgi:hypothetical protein
MDNKLFSELLHSVSQTDGILRGESAPSGKLRRTYFGLEVIAMEDKVVVRYSDIERLPFFDFWLNSARGSAMLAGPDGGPGFVYLRDWEAFACLFIRTGRHRYMPQL